MPTIVQFAAVSHAKRKLPMKTLRHLFLLFMLLVLAGCAGQEARQATLFYTTDTHGRLAADAESIGMDRIAALKKQTPTSLLVDAGDFLQGNPTVNLSQGKDAVRLMKMAGYYAATLGNHEFDFGQEALQARIAEAAAGPEPLYILSANVLRADGRPFVRPSVIATVNGLKIGFFGLTTEETATQTHPRNIHGLVFADVLSTAARMAAQLRAEGCDVVVALTHVGTAGVSGITSRNIAARVPGIDVVIDGHSHVELHETMANGTLLVSSGAHAKAVGKLLLAGGPSGAMLKKSAALLHKKDMEAITPDPALTAALAQIKAEQAVLLERVVGMTPVNLDGERTQVRTRETNFGNLCADALRHMTGADIAIVNGGSIRRSIAQGEITKGDIIAAIPFADAVVTKEITGAELIEILEHGLRGLPAENGGFPQLSGLRLRLDPTRPAGQRVVSVTLDDGKPIDAQGRYTLAMPDFLAAGGDGYAALAKPPVIKQYLPPDTALELYLKDFGAKAFDHIAPGRVIIPQQRTISIFPARLCPPDRPAHAAM